MCDLAANVVCPGAPAPGPPGSECTHPEGSGDVNNPETCAAFQFCNNGVRDPVIESCGELHFNPTTNVCDLPANLDPPCVDVPVAGSPVHHAHIPKAPAVTTTTFKDRFMRKLHLRN